MIFTSHLPAALSSGLLKLFTASCSFPLHLLVVLVLVANINNNSGNSARETFN
jgi:hypothetical protein